MARVVDCGRLEQSFQFPKFANARSCQKEIDMTPEIATAAIRDRRLDRRENATECSIDDSSLALKPKNRPFSAGAPDGN